MMLQNRKRLIKVPRKRLNRFVVRFLGRLVLRFSAEVNIVGIENLPQTGRAILVGNHVAVMEPVMMAVYSPRQIEFLGSIDVPHEPSTRWAIKFYGMIEFFRGKPERHALRQALSVLEQDGLLGLFPEGGLWNPGTMKPKDGVAFLSHRAAAPVVPISFVGTKGALNQLFSGKKPKLEMIIGRPIPACTVGEDANIRQVYDGYSAMVMEKVLSQLPASVLDELYDIAWERFFLSIVATDSQGNELPIPGNLAIREQEALALLLHRPGILKIFGVNLKMPVSSLQHLHLNPSPQELLGAIDPIIAYLEEEKKGNPYLLTYRFDLERGKAMLRGLKDLRKLVEWADQHDYQLKILPERRFFSKKWQKEFVQIEQGEFDHWR